MHDIIKNKYCLQEKIGSGGFGDIWKAMNLLTEEYVAIKTEKNNEKSILKREATIMKHLDGINGVPKMRNFGTWREEKFLVMDLLGSSLSELKNTYKVLSMKTVVQLGYQIIKIIARIHEKGIIHRDIKPDNFLLDTNNHSVYLIDFGLSRLYVDDVGKHKPIRQNRHLTGTVRYLSINCQKGFEPSRRDDLIAICYMLVYLLKDRLPWQNIIAKTKKEKFKKILNKKEKVSNISLCAALPKQMLDILDYCMTMTYDESPDYEYILSKLVDMAREYNMVLDGKYEWT